MKGNPNYQMCQKGDTGTRCPTIGAAVAMGYVPPELAESGQELVLDVRGREVEARVVGLPFYKRTK